MPNRTCAGGEREMSDRLGPYRLNRIYTGDCLELSPAIPDESIDLIFWSGPYFVGKNYEQGLSFNDWLSLYRAAIGEAARILKAGHFLAINCADILSFSDPTLPRVRACVLSRQLPVTLADIAPLMEAGFSKYEIAEKLNCSEQTVDRRLNGNNARGGKQEPQTRVELVCHHLAGMARGAGLYLYDRRVWAKDPAWESCQWHSVSYRSIDEFEYVLVFVKPGVIEIDRARLTPEEWGAWGSRGVWHIPSVRTNDVHEAMFPIELAHRVIRLFSGFNDVVCDFFVGSGTTAQAAIELGRRWLAFEIDPDTAETARRRVRQTQPPLFTLEAEQLRMEAI